MKKLIALLWFLLLASAQASYVSGGGGGGGGSSYLPLAGGTLTGPVAYSDGTNKCPITAGWGSPVTCTTSATVNWSSSGFTHIELDLTASDTCVLTLSDMVAGCPVLLSVKNAAAAVLTQPSTASFGGGSYTPGGAGTYDHLIYDLSSDGTHMSINVGATGLSYP
jgi:hypothetical protein